jgi:hypothetical protein
MIIVTHLAALAAACFFGYRSSDSFELLIVGVALLVLACGLPLKRILLFKIQVVIIRALKLEQPKNEELIGLGEDCLVKLDSPNVEDLAATIFAITSTVLLCKSIYLMIHTL